MFVRQAARRYFPWMILVLSLAIIPELSATLASVGLQAAPLRLAQLNPLQTIVQLATGGDHTCALIEGGSVKCWGNNYSGQLGDGTTSDHSTPVVVPGLSSVTTLATGIEHTCAVTGTSPSPGHIQCWGNNGHGQLGDGTMNHRSTPVEVNGLRNVSRLTAGGWHTCALLNDGRVQCWGYNDYGQLGDGTSTDRNTPVAVNGLSDASALAGGMLHTCALTSSGVVYCWGSNSAGQLGDGTTLDHSTPTVAPGLSGVASLTAGGAHTCVLLNDSRVQCWGDNRYGQLGDGTTTNRSTPVVVTGLSGVTALKAGAWYTCALLNDGRVQCWGYNGHGQLGDGTTTDHSTPVVVTGLGGVTALATGGGHSCVLTNGRTQCWGANYAGQLGNGTITYRPTPSGVNGLSDITALATGGVHACALTTSERVQCWGYNNSGQLGDGTFIHRSTPAVVTTLSGATAVVTGWDHSCARSYGSVWCWGSNSYGQLGDGTTTIRSIPVQVAGLSNVTTVVAGGWHNCALIDGGVWCWGYNDSGRLGDGTTTDRSLPVEVIGLSDATALAAGAWHTCALTGASPGYGQVQCWGNNYYGQLGDGATTNASTPVAVIGLSEGVIALATGGQHTCGLTSSGRVLCWGANGSGQLGDGTTSDQRTPVQVSGLTDAVLLAAGWEYTCAVSSSRGLLCWGANELGQVGDGTTVNRTVPVAVTGLNGSVASLATGGGHTCVLAAGQPMCWGDDSFGQVGTGRPLYSATPVDVVDLSAPPTMTPTATATPTLTPTPTATPTATATPPAVSAGDVYEADDSCTQAQPIASDGSNQDHTFHRQADVDWVRFDATASVQYRIEVQVPAESPADVDLEVYTTCDSTPAGEWHESFSPGARLDFTAAAAGSIYVRLANYDAGQFGEQVTYQLAVRVLDSAPTNKAVIIVAGRLRGADRLQANIHAVTGAIYQLFQRNGYTDDNIYYLATDSRLPGYDAAASKDTLRAAITTWAPGKVDGNGVLTLYMIDHGNPELFYIDDLNGQRLTPAELDEWLAELEAALPGIKINVIIEACQSGSFIAQPQSISRPGRIVITSTSADQDAKASLAGAYFSDHFITGLHQGYSLTASFAEARKVAQQVFALQDAWLDADGDGVPNEFEDAVGASKRSFAYAGTLQSNEWPPHIFQVSGPDTIANYSGMVQVDVRDDVKVSQVWAVVYPPDYAPPASSQELQAETLPSFNLTPTGEADSYGGIYSGFTQSGVYRIVLHAMDSDGLVAHPRTLEVVVGSKVYLPLITR